MKRLSFVAMLCLLLLRCDAGRVAVWGVGDSGTDYGQDNIPPGITDVVNVDVGSGINIIQKADGSIMTWGVPATGYEHSVYELARIPDMGKVKKFVPWRSHTGLTHLVSLLEDGTVTAWPQDDSGVFDVFNGLTDIVDIFNGGSHFLALRSDGTIVATDSPNHQFVAPQDLKDVISIETRGSIFFALQGNGTVRIWGVGSGDYHPEQWPKLVQIKAGVHVLGLTETGTVIQLKSDNPYIPEDPDFPEGLTDVVQIELGNQNAAALKADGTVVSWGRNIYSAQPTIQYTNIMETPPGIKDVVDIASGGYYFLALKSDGTLEGWGQLPHTIHDIPQELEDDIVRVDAGYGTLLALRNNGTLVGWGRNERFHWNLGGTITGQSDVPEDLSGVVDFDADRVYSCALLEDGSIEVWGETSVVWQPVITSGWMDIPPDLEDVVDISADGYRILALKADGTVVSWGNGEDNYPQDLTNVTAVSGSEYALKADGTVVSWDDYDIPLDPHNEVIEMPDGLNNVIAIDSGREHCLALKEDGSVVAWGQNRSGQCDIPEDLEPLVAISAGYKHNLGLTAQGEIVAWGDNSNGQCDVPPGLKGVTSISAGEYHSAAVYNPDQWGGYPVLEGEQVNADDWLGWLDVTDAPIIWSYSINSWLYMEEPGENAPGAWAYFFK